MQGAQRLSLDAGGGAQIAQWPGRAGEGVGIAGSWGSLGSAVTRNEALTLRSQGSRWRLDLGIRPGGPHRPARGVGTGRLDPEVTDPPGGQGQRGGGDPERLRNGERNRDRDAQGQRDTRLGRLAGEKALRWRQGNAPVEGRGLRGPTPRSTLSPARCPACLPWEGRGSRPGARAHVSTRAPLRRPWCGRGRGACMAPAGFRCVQPVCKSAPALAAHTILLSCAHNGQGWPEARAPLPPAASSCRRQSPSQDPGFQRPGWGPPNLVLRTWGHNGKVGSQSAGKGLGSWAGACPACIPSLGAVLRRKGGGR